MELYEFKNNEIITIDLHNMSVFDAAQHLNQAVTYAPNEIKEIVVIHGYHRGDSLLNMVRKDFRNKRVHRKFLSMNPGVTSLILK